MRAVERIVQIWRPAAAKGTQLVFCDLSTPKWPKGAGGSAPAPVASGAQGLELVEEDFFPGTSSEDTAPAANSAGEEPEYTVEAGDDDGADNTVAA